MDFFIKKLFDGNTENDPLVHLQFQKFSKGTFANRAMLKAKKTAKKYAINTTAEYANELVRTVAEKLGDEKAAVAGVVVSTRDLKEELDYKEIKQFQGVKRYILDTEMSGTDIIALCEKLPQSFIGLSFKTPDGTELKIKPKAPKSGKPSSKNDEKPSPDFCKLKTTDETIVQNLLFDVPEFKEVLIEHTFIIDDIEIDYSIEDPKEMREQAKRKGTIKRILTLDGEEKTTETQFTA